MTVDAEFVPDKFVYVGLRPDQTELMATNEEPDHFIRHHDGRVLLFNGDDNIVLMLDQLLKLRPRQQRQPAQSSYVRGVQND